MARKEGVISIRLGGDYIARLDKLCVKTYRTRAKQLQALIDVGALVIDLDQMLRPAANVCVAIPSGFY